MFEMPSADVDRMIKTLLSEEDEDLNDDIRNLSRQWITDVMSQPSKSNKLKVRSFGYSKKKISDVLKWKKKRGLLNSMIPDAIKNLEKGEVGDIRVFQNNCFYW